MNVEEHLEKNLDIYRALKDQAEMNEDFKTFTKYVDLIEDVKHELKGRHEKEEQMLWHEIEWLLKTFTDWTGGKQQIGVNINVKQGVSSEYSLIIYQRLEYLKKLLKEAMERNKNV
jgi:hypothetical protein